MMGRLFFSNRKSNRNFGFTLLEVVIALGIMGTVMIVLTSSWRGNFRRVKKAKIQTQAVYLLQKKMTELEVFYAGKVKELPKESQTGKFKDKNLKNYSWQWQAGEFKMPDIARLFTSEEGIVDETSVTILNKMKKYMEESVREVKLTLLYQASPKSKPIKYSISTIFVDYDVPLEIGLGGL
jgi:prepilin-type N-terminal cleavage/methylation domain-containing protein